MTNKKYKFEQELINSITPHVLQPEQEKAKLIIIEILNKIKDEFSYGCINCLNEMDEFYGRMYGAERINTDYIETVISNLEIM